MSLFKRCRTAYTRFHCVALAGKAAHGIQEVCDKRQCLPKLFEFMMNLLPNRPAPAFFDIEEAFKEGVSESVKSRNVQ